MREKLRNKALIYPEIYFEAEENVPIVWASTKVMFEYKGVKYLRCCIDATYLREDENKEDDKIKKILSDRLRAMQEDIIKYGIPFQLTDLVDLDGNKIEDEVVI